jgi:MFS family permease
MHKYHQEFHLNKFIHNTYNDLVIADTFRNVALSLAAIFIPIFLLEIGFSVMQLCYYELGLFISSVIFHYYILAHLQHWGVKKSLILSYLLSIVFYFILYFSDSLISDFGDAGFLFFLGIFNAFPTALYWSAHHVYFIKSTDGKNDGKKLGILLSIPTILCIASPFIGSILITKFDFYGVFVVSIVLMFLAAWALNFSKDMEPKIKLNFEKIINKKNKRKNLIFFLQGIGYAATSFVWPVFLFLMSIKIISVGFLFLFSKIFAAATTYLGGKNSDLGKSRNIGRVGAIGHGLSLIFRALSTTVLTMTAFQSMGGFFGGLLGIAIDSSFFKKSHLDIANSIMSRELYMHLGRIFLIIVLIVLLNFFSVINTLIISLIIAGITTFSLNLVIKSDYSMIS